MTRELLAVTDLHKRFGGVVATDIFSFGVLEGETHAVIGPNGAGKTTLISQLAGELFPDAGQILFKGRNITRMRPERRARRGIARSFQVTNVLGELSVLDNVLLAVFACHGHCYHFWQSAYTNSAMMAVARRHVSTIGLEARMHERAGTLSHGEQRQLEVAVALATEPDLLLLDEPMAGMGAEESVDMLCLLKSLKTSKTLLLVEHDMDAVFAIADRISVLVSGRIIATGPPEAIRSDKSVEEAYLGGVG